MGNLLSTKAFSPTKQHNENITKLRSKNTTENNRLAIHIVSAHTHRLDESTETLPDVSFTMSHEKLEKRRHLLNSAVLTLCFLKVNIGATKCPRGATLAVSRELAN